MPHERPPDAGQDHARAEATPAKNVAAQAGELRVVVRLRPATESESSHQAFALTREALLRELTGTRHAVGRVSAALPLLALTVSPEALRVLQRTALITTIHVEEWR